MRLKSNPIPIPRPPAHRRIAHRAARRRAEFQHCRPLLDPLLQVLRIQRRVRGAVEHPHLGPGHAAVTSAAHPLSTRLDGVPLCARVAPHVVPVAGEAAERDTRKARKTCASRKHVRVRPA